MKTIKELEAVLLRDSARLEELCNYQVTTMNLGQLKDNLIELEKTEKRLNVTIVQLEDLKELEENNTKLAEFEE
jgi:hypothetical protein